MSDKSALVGHTGFVGSSLKAARDFTHLYNSTNIESIRGEEFDTIVCAGAPAAMWVANAQPDADRRNVQRLMENLRHARARRFFLISTVAVFAVPRGVDENTKIETHNLPPYGLHRYELENFTCEHFAKACIVRLPALFGHGFKKNALYDLLNDNNLEQVPMNGVFQWYNMACLADDLERVAHLPLIHFAPPPVSMDVLVDHLFPDKKHIGHRREAPSYDMRTIHANLFGKTGSYIADVEQVLSDLEKFVAEYRAQRAS